MLLVAAVPVCSRAQLPINPQFAPQIDRLLDGPAQTDSMQCSVKPVRPDLDFALRFYAGYFISLPVKQFQGKEALVTVYARVTPAGSSPRLFADRYRLPAITPALRDRMGSKWDKTRFGSSGGFAVGEGDYRIELLLIDDQNRTCRKQWAIKAERKGRQHAVQLLVNPHTVESLLLLPGGDEPIQRRSGLRATVLLNAAPINPRQAKLRAWDRAFLLSSLWSLLRQIPCSSIRVVAFSLDQQREIFRQDGFDRAALDRLSRILKELELETVSVRALQRPASEFLISLANQEIEAEHAADVVVLLGPWTRYPQKPRPESFKARDGGAPRFFNFEYFPWHFAHLPDAGGNLAHTLHAPTYEMHSPRELGEDIQKMLRDLKQE